MVVYGRTPAVITTGRGGTQRSATLTFNGYRDVVQREERDWYPGSPGSLLARTNYSYVVFNDMTFPRVSAVELSGVNPAKAALSYKARPNSSTTRQR